MNWSLSTMLSEVHSDIEHRLAAVRNSLGHPGTLGNASEHVWLDLLTTYLPRRYKAATGHIVDSHGQFSDQIDIVVFDRQYSPFLFSYQGQTVIPAESVYAVLESKQVFSSITVKAAHAHALSVRSLHRTSLPIPSAGGLLPPKRPHHIIAGLLALDSEWPNPEKYVLKNLAAADPDARLDIGCIAAHGYFTCDENGSHTFIPHNKAATAFLFELIARLQACATAPMIDIHAYAKWLDKDATEPSS
jgi:hypothetical protein